MYESSNHDNLTNAVLHIQDVKGKQIMDKRALAQKIKTLEGLSNDEKSALLELLHERKKYGIVWEDKPENVEIQMASELPVLTEVRERAIVSDDKSAPNHILIEGDNLHALTALSYTHAGKIDVIYIDPPYNTGNKDFIFNDSYVDKEDSYRHSKWLSFMSKRLEIAKQLLSEKGVIFISIDDNEQAQLKLLCDEIFGADAFIDFFIRLTTKSGKTPVDFMRSHEYALCYAHDHTIFRGVDFVDESYKFSDEYMETRGMYNLKQPLDCNSISYSRSLDYVIEHNGISYYPGGDKEKYLQRKNGNYLPKDYAWRWSRELYEFGLKNGWIVFKNGRIYTKGYLNATIEKRGDGYQIVYLDKERKRSTIDFVTNDYSNDIAKKQLSILNLNTRFDFPKPINFVSDLIATHKKSDSIILDFFAGSGTTLHATMQLNDNDNGHRQCILVTNNENNICEEVTYERNRRVIQGYTKPNGEVVEGLHSNNLRYYKTAFVPREKTMSNKRALTAAATDLLCIKNNIYQEAGEFGGVKLHPKVARYFDDGKTKMLVIYAEAAISNFVELLLDMKVEGKILVYVFAGDNYAYNNDFEEVLDKVELCALPDAIYKAYKKILPSDKIVEDTESSSENEADNADEEDEK